MATASSINYTRRFNGPINNALHNTEGALGGKEIVCYTRKHGRTLEATDFQGRHLSNWSQQYEEPVFDFEGRCVQRVGLPQLPIASHRTPQGDHRTVLIAIRFYSADERWYCGILLALTY